VKLELEIDDGVAAELKYLVELHQRHGAANRQETVEDMLTYVASAVADGSRRPGAWERTVIEMMGLVPDAPEAGEYRARYGRPDGSRQ